MLRGEIFCSGRCSGCFGLPGPRGGRKRTLRMIRWRGIHDLRIWHACAREAGERPIGHWSRGRPGRPRSSAYKAEGNVSCRVPYHGWLGPFVLSLHRVQGIMPWTGHLATRPSADSRKEIQVRAAVLRSQDHWGAAGMSENSLRHTGPQAGMAWTGEDLSSFVSMYSR